MWKAESFLDSLSSYSKYDSINAIYVIDNHQSQRPPEVKALEEKVQIISYGQNIYVNRAWNEGYFRSQADIICLLNDDVFVEEGVFDFVAHLDVSKIDIIGSYLKGSVDNFHIVEHPDKKEELIRMNVNKKQPIGGQSYAFGVCMFIKRSSYRVIPSLYQVWFGDDYLIQRCKHIYALKTSKIHGEISKTIETSMSQVAPRINLDIHNAYKYGHFQNAKNWDILKKRL
jgi:hypothetical protein